MVPRRYKTSRPKNSQYDTRPDGSLLCGPGCFSKINVLKQRFTERKYAVSAKKHDQDVYDCEYCKGFHLTHMTKKRKHRGKTFPN